MAQYTYPGWCLQFRSAWKHRHTHPHAKQWLRYCIAKMRSLRNRTRDQRHLEVDWIG